MSGPLRFRAGDVSDARAVAAVMRAAIRVLARGSHPARVLALWSSLPPLYHRWAMSAGGEDYLVAERGGRLEGYAALHGGEVTAVFVRPAVARRGVGRALLARVERLARRRGERSLLVRAARGAVPFYEASGYARGGRTWVPLPGGAHLDAVVLRKTLPGAAARRPGGGRRGGARQASRTDAKHGPAPRARA